MSSAASRSSFVGRNLYWIASLALAALCAGGIVTLLGDNAHRVRYWVLATAVPAREPITPAMLAERSAVAGTVPDTWIDVDYVASHQPLYARTSLPADAVLLPGNVSTEQRVGTQVPAGYVTASFQAEPQNAVAGRLTAGDYVDVGALVDSAAPGVPGGRTSAIVLHHVLVLDVTDAPVTLRGSADGVRGPDPASSSDLGSESDGAASLYTVAVSYRDWAKLMLLHGSTIFLALSPADAPATLKEPVTATTADTLGGRPLGDSSAALPRSTDGGTP